MRNLYVPPCDGGKWCRNRQIRMLAPLSLAAPANNTAFGPTSHVSHNDVSEQRLGGISSMDVGHRTRSAMTSMRMALESEGMTRNGHTVVSSSPPCPAGADRVIAQSATLDSERHAHGRARPHRGRAASAGAVSLLAPIHTHTQLGAPPTRVATVHPAHPTQRTYSEASSAVDPRAPRHPHSQYLTTRAASVGAGTTTITHGAASALPPPRANAPRDSCTAFARVAPPLPPHKVALLDTARAAVEGELAGTTVQSPAASYDMRSHHNLATFRPLPNATGSAVSGKDSCVIASRVGPEASLFAQRVGGGPRGREEGRPGGRGVSMPATLLDTDFPCRDSELQCGGGREGGEERVRPMGKGGVEAQSPPSAVAPSSYGGGTAQSPRSSGAVAAAGGTRSRGDMAPSANQWANGAATAAGSAALPHCVRHSITVLSSIPSPTTARTAGCVLNPTPMSEGWGRPALRSAFPTPPPPQTKVAQVPTVGSGVTGHSSRVRRAVSEGAVCGAGGGRSIGISTVCMLSSDSYSDSVGSEASRQSGGGTRGGKGRRSVVPSRKAMEIEDAIVAARAACAAPAPSSTAVAVPLSLQAAARAPLTLTGTGIGCAAQKMTAVSTILQSQPAARVNGQQHNAKPPPQLGGDVACDRAGSISGRRSEGHPLRRKTVPRSKSLTRATSVPSASAASHVGHDPTSSLHLHTAGSTHPAGPPGAAVVQLLPPPERVDDRTTSSAYRRKPVVGPCEKLCATSTHAAARHAAAVAKHEALLAPTCPVDPRPAPCASSDVAGVGGLSRSGADTTPLPHPGALGADGMAVSLPLHAPPAFSADAHPQAAHPPLHGPSRAHPHEQTHPHIHTQTQAAAVAQGQAHSHFRGVTVPPSRSPSLASPSASNATAVRWGGTEVHHLGDTAAAGGGDGHPRSHVPSPPPPPQGREGGSAVPTAVTAALQRLAATATALSQFRTLSHFEAESPPSSTPLSGSHAAQWGGWGGRGGSGGVEIHSAVTAAKTQALERGLRAARRLRDASLAAHSLLDLPARGGGNADDHLSTTLSGETKASPTLNRTRMAAHPRGSVDDDLNTSLPTHLHLRHDGPAEVDRLPHHHLPSFASPPQRRAAHLAPSRGEVAEEEPVYADLLKRFHTDSDAHGTSHTARRVHADGLKSMMPTNTSNSTHPTHSPLHPHAHTPPLLPPHPPAASVSPNGAAHPPHSRSCPPLHGSAALSVTAHEDYCSHGSPPHPPRQASPRGDSWTVGVPAPLRRDGGGDRGHDGGPRGRDVSNFDAHMSPSHTSPPSLVSPAGGSLGATCVADVPTVEYVGGGGLVLGSGSSLSHAHPHHPPHPTPRPASDGALELSASGYGRPVYVSSCTTRTTPSPLGASADGFGLGVSGGASGAGGAGVAGGGGAVGESLHATVGADGGGGASVATGVRASSPIQPPQRGNKPSPRPAVGGDEGRDGRGGGGGVRGGGSDTTASSIPSSTQDVPPLRDVGSPSMRVATAWSVAEAEVAAAEGAERGRMPSPGGGIADALD